MNPTQILPISPWQQRLILVCSDPGCSESFHDRLLLRWAHLISPRADDRRVQRAFNKLVARHDSLRLKFRKIGKAWKAEVSPVHLQGLTVEHIGDVDDDKFSSIVEQRSQQKIDVLSDVLFEMHLLKFGERGDVLLWRAHHAILDGYSAVLVIEEFIKLLLNVPIIKKPPTHGQFVSHIKAKLEDNAAEKAAFWENEILPLPPEPNIGRKMKGRTLVPGHLVQKTITVDNVLDRHEIDTLKKRASQQGLSLYAYLYTAFAEILCDEAKSDDILICTVVGRNDSDMKDFVGAYIQLITLKYTKTKGGTLDEAAAEVVQSLHAGTAHTPTTAFMPNSNIDAAYKKSGRQRLQFYVHRPDGNRRTDNSIFSLNKGNKNSVSFGLFRIEALELATHSHTDAELQLTLRESSVALGADAESFSGAELANLKVKMRKKLDIQ